MGQVTRAATLGFLLLAGLLTAPPTAANGNRLYLDCPCEIESDGSTLGIAAGVRSFRPSDSGALSLRVEARTHVDEGRGSRVDDWEVPISGSLPGETELDTATY